MMNNTGGDAILDSLNIWLLACSCIDYLTLDWRDFSSSQTDYLLCGSRDP
jgi:hypothetical protein